MEQPMHIKVRNVEHAFREMVSGIHSGAIPTEVRASRNGEVLQIPEVCTITYERPQERVLLNSARDASPFLHLYESLWMLVGRNDVGPLIYYAKQFKEYTDDGETLHGAYGHRWRKRFGYDQLEWIVEELKSNPHSRRCVLQIWDPGSWYDEPNGPGCGGRCALEFTQDLYFATHGGKDVPCNLSVLFSVSGGWTHNDPQRLDMTVFNRSNDMIWGALGANVVHFSVLQEYIAARLGVAVGVYNQVSNNMHIYSNNWKPTEWLAYYDQHGAPDLYHAGTDLVPLLTAEEVALFDAECAEFVERHQRDAIGGYYRCRFLREVAQPMCVAFHHHKRREYNCALMTAGSILADDWRVACTAWLHRREANYGRKHKVVGI
jgi:thymidylate synthase